MKLDINKILSMPLKDRFKYLKENEKDLIKTKRSSEITSDVCYYPPIQTKGSVFKGDETQDTGVIHVKVVANTANWIDSQMDMLLPGSWDKSVNERKRMIPHLHDHERSIAAKVGEVTDIYGQELTYGELGIKGIGYTKALVFETDIMKAYNEKVYNMYKGGGVNQHSIGLRYIQLDLAMNDQNSPEALAEWNKYINQAINKQMAIDAGFFWVVKEFTLIENSAVLFGANEITPTLEVREPGKADAMIINEPTKSLDINYLISKL